MKCKASKMCTCNEKLKILTIVCTPERKYKGDFKNCIVLVKLINNQDPLQGGIQV